MSDTRQSITAAIEHAGVVAVIRIKEPRRLRAVVDALAEGGLSRARGHDDGAGRRRSDRELAPTLPAGFLLGAGTVTRRRHRRAGSSTPARSSSSARCSGRR